MKENLLMLFQTMVTVFCKSEKLAMKSSSDSLVKIVYKHLGLCIKKYLNYNFFALPFNRNFFLKNFLKNLVLYDFLNESGYDFADCILDVGCGAAPASIALSMLLAKEQEKNLQVNLLDKSYQQLNLALALFRELSIEVCSCSREAFHFTGQGYNQLVLFSYFICEQETSFIKYLYENRDSFKYGCIILDYKYVIDRIKRTFEQHGDYRIKTVCLSMPLQGRVADMLLEKEVKIYGCYFKNE